MLGEIDIYRAAKLLIDRHHDDAPIHAAMRAVALMDQGDMEGRAVWLRIKAAVEEPLFVRKSGSSPVQIADVCAYILARALANANYSRPLLEKIRPQLVSGFVRNFVTSSSEERPS